MLYRDQPISPRTYLPNQLILAAFQTAVLVLWWASLVEHVKVLAVRLGACRGDQSDDRQTVSRSVGIDIYEIGKWLFLWVAFSNLCNSNWFGRIVLYLLISNLFSHFYYHVWKESDPKKLLHMNMLRRLSSFLLAFSFMIMGYAYMFFAWYSPDIQWPDGQVTIPNATFLSVTNTFTLTYGDYGPLAPAARFIFMSEVIYAFFFLVIIVSKSLPASE